MKQFGKRLLATLVAFSSIITSACGATQDGQSVDFGSQNGSQGSSHACVFSEEVVKPEYLAKAATCQESAQYYYSCQCGERGESVFADGKKGSHDFSAEIVAPKYAKVEATCLKGGEYHKSCTVCGTKSYYTFVVEPLAHEYVYEIMTDKYLKEEATHQTEAVYYKSCSCGAIGDATFLGEKLREFTDEEKIPYTPISLTVSLYDPQNSLYGFTYNTQSEPLKPVIQVRRAGTQDAWKDYPAKAEKATSYYEDESVLNYYIVKAEAEFAPNTVYEYRAYDKHVDIGTEIVTFETKDWSAESFIFAHTSDTQGYPEYFGDVLKNLVGLSDFIVHSGDVVENSKLEAEWTAMLNGNFGYFSKIPMMAISGNHETTYKNGSNETYKHFNNKMPTQASTKLGYFYSFVYGNAKFLMLNTNDLSGNKLKTEQYNWLVNELKNNTATWTIVVMHNPIYSVGKYGANPDRNQIALALRLQLQGIFAQYGVDLVLQGHDHAVSRTYPIDENGVPLAETFDDVNGVEYSVNPKGVLYLMNGTSGGQTRSPHKVDETLYKYAEASTSRMWAEFSINGQMMEITVKACNGTDVTEVKKWGIKKTA